MDLELHPIDVRGEGAELGGSEAGAQDSEEGDLRRKIIIIMELDFDSIGTSLESYIDECLYLNFFLPLKTFFRGGMVGH